MKKYLFLLPLLISGCGFFKALRPQPPPPPETPKIDVVTRAVTNTVAIITAEGAIACSGVAAEDFILTAYHCEDVAHTVRYQGKDHRFVVALSWEDRDLLVLQLIGKRMKGTVPLALQEPVLGQKAVWLGYPLGQELILATGVVGRAKTLDGYLAVYGQFIPGNSGGPVFDETGKLMGVISSTMAVPGVPFPQLLPVGYAVHWDTLKEALAALD